MRIFSAFSFVFGFNFNTHNQESILRLEKETFENLPCILINEDQVYFGDLRQRAFQKEFSFDSFHCWVGAPSFARDHQMRPPLIWAAASQSLKTVQYLLNYKADANDSDVDGYTPLHLASQSGKYHHFGTNWKLFHLYRIVHQRLKGLSKKTAELIWAMGRIKKVKYVVLVSLLKFEKKTTTSMLHMDFAGKKRCQRKPGIAEVTDVERKQFKWSQFRVAFRMRLSGKLRIVSCFAFSTYKIICKQFHRKKRRSYYWNKILRWEFWAILLVLLPLKNFITREICTIESQNFKDLWFT